MIPDALPGRSRRLAAVVVNHKTPADTALAVQSLLVSKRRLDAIVVVDNDTVADPQLTAPAWAERVEYTHTGRNLGFAGGANVGVRVALDGGADAVFLLNSDAEVSAGCVGRLDDALQATSQVGIAAPLLLSREDHGVVASAGIDYDIHTGRMRERLAGRRHADVDTAPGERIAVSGCALLVARETWRRVGMFDERYFFGFEDIDLCLRAGAAGIRTVLVDGAVVYHQGGGTLAPTSRRRFYFAARNHLFLAHAHPGGGPLAGLVRPFTVSALNIAHALTSTGGSRAGKLWATLRGITDYVAGRTGEPPL